MAGEADRIRIGEELRRDATGAWHRAELGGRPYTLRILRADLAEREEARLVFEQEMRRIERLDHPGLVRIHRVGRKPPRPWMLSDPIDGRSLEEALAADGPLEPDAARLLAGGLHEALRYLDGRTQVHDAPWPSQLVEIEGTWRLPTFRAIRARDGLKRLKRKTNPHADWTPPEVDPEHPASVAPEPWIAWAVGTLLRAASGDAEAVRPAVARLCDPDPARRPAGAPAVARALASADAGGASGASARPPAPVRRKRRER